MEEDYADFSLVEQDKRASLRSIDDLVIKAASKGDLETVEHLVKEFGLNVSEVRGPENGLGVLHAASKAGKIDFIVNVLNKFDSLDVDDLTSFEDGERTSILFAAENGHINVVEFFIAQNATINFEDSTLYK